MNFHASRPHTIRFLVGAMAALALSASPVHAQFGALKKLKDKVTGTPDSTEKKDSTKNGTDTTKAKGQSFFSKAASLAGAANEKLESTTGISAKDAALAATGVGAANMIAKKLGGATDGSGIANAVGKAVAGGGVNSAAVAQGAMQQGAAGAAQGAMQQLAAGKAGAGKIPTGLPGGLAGLMPGGAGANLPKLPAGTPNLGNGATSDEKEMVAFQQDLMQVAMKASAGDAAANARLEAWQALVVRYQPEINKLQQQMVGGDMTVVRKIQDIQLKMMRDWSNTSGIKPKKP